MGRTRRAACASWARALGGSSTIDVAAVAAIGGDVRARAGAWCASDGRIRRSIPSPGRGSYDPRGAAESEVRAQRRAVERPRALSERDDLCSPPERRICRRILQHQRYMLTPEWLRAVPNSRGARYLAASASRLAGARWRELARCHDRLVATGAAAAPQRPGRRAVRAAGAHDDLQASGNRDGCDQVLGAAAGAAASAAVPKLDAGVGVPGATAREAGARTARDVLLGSVKPRAHSGVHCVAEFLISISKNLCELDRDVDIEVDGGAPTSRSGPPLDNGS